MKNTPVSPSGHSVSYVESPLAAAVVYAWPVIVK